MLTLSHSSGQIAYAEKPLLEAVEVGVALFGGKLAGAAAKQVFKAAQKTGLVKVVKDKVVQIGKDKLLPLVDKGFVSSHGHTAVYVAWIAS